MSEQVFFSMKILDRRFETDYLLEFRKFFIISNVKSHGVSKKSALDKDRIFKFKFKTFVIVLNEKTRKFLKIT